jgi:hypothetical protein
MKMMTQATHPVCITACGMHSGVTIYWPSIPAAMLNLKCGQIFIESNHESPHSSPVDELRDPMNNKEGDHVGMLVSPAPRTVILADLSFPFAVNRSSSLAE